MKIESRPATRQWTGWWQDRHWRADVALALLVAVIALAGTYFVGQNQPDQRALDAAALALLAAGAAALVFRRHYPGWVLLFVNGITLLYLLLDYPKGPIFVIPYIAFFTAVMQDRRLIAWAVLAGEFVLFPWLPYLLGNDPAPTPIGLWGRAGWLLVLATVAELAHFRQQRLIRTREEEARRRAGEERLRIAHENAALQKRSLEITERLFRSGNDSELDVQQAKSLYLSTLATIPQLAGSLRQSQNGLSVLLARPPGPLPEMTAGGIPQAGLEIIRDLPAELLRRRPDVRAAELQLAAQSALIGVSEAELYPAISLLGSLGLSATSRSGSVTALDWGVGPGLVWNVFDHGRLSNQVLVQDARFQQLYEQYQETVLRAAREVDDAAVGFASNRQQIGLLADAVHAARRSLDIATIQYREGMTDFQRVLDAQRTLFSQQERRVTNLGDVSQSLIALYKAMGGGWEQGRDRPLLDEPTRERMGERSDWKALLQAPLPAPAAGPKGEP